MPENLFRLNQKPCKNLSVDDYLLTKAHSHKIVNIDHLKANATFKLESPTKTTTNSTSHSNHVPISIDVRHDLFDAKYGLVRNVFYTGRFYWNFAFHSICGAGLNIFRAVLIHGIMCNPELCVCVFATVCNTPHSIIIFGYKLKWKKCMLIEEQLSIAVVMLLHQESWYTKFSQCTKFFNMSLGVE